MNDLEAFIALIDQTERVKETPLPVATVTPEDFAAELKEDPRSAFAPGVQVKSIELTDSYTYRPLNIERDFEREIVLDLARQLLSRGPFSLVDLEDRPFEGGGIYALFYHGALNLYEPIRSPDATCPIYIGKSAQLGRRQGGTEKDKRCLHSRFVQYHCKSLDQAGLDRADFTFRFLVLPDFWVGFAEHALIELFQPLWNTSVNGFGGRYHAEDKRRGPDDQTSRWDTLHPGRRGVATKARSLDDVEREARDGIQSSLIAYHALKKAIG